MRTGVTTLRLGWCDLWCVAAVHAVVVAAGAHHHVPAGAAVHHGGARLLAHHLLRARRAPRAHATHDQDLQ